MLKNKGELKKFVVVITMTSSSSCISRSTEPQHPTSVKEMQNPQLCRKHETSLRWHQHSIKVSCFTPLLLTPSSTEEVNYCQPTRKLPTGTGCISVWTSVRDFPNGSTWTLNEGCLIMKLNVETSLFLIYFVNENVACFTPNGKFTGDFGLCI